MSFFLSPIKFVFELIGFLVSAAFVYGLALIVAVTIIVYGISTSPVNKYTNPKIVETVVEKVERKPELTCERVTGCELFPNAPTEREYCPTCIFK